MAVIIDDLPQFGGYFKPADLLDAAALLVEVKQFERQRPTNNGPKDTATIDVTVFATEAEAVAGTPTVVIQNVWAEQKLLVRDLANKVGRAVVVTLAKLAPKQPGQKGAYVFNASSPTLRKAVADYAEKREQEIEAALAAAPSFD